MLRQPSPCFAGSVSLYLKRFANIVRRPMTDPIVCLLCGDANPRANDSLTGADIKNLWDLHGDTLSAQALLPVRPESKVVLYRCGKCGFRFFDSSLCGTPQFYEELAKNTYYAVNPPEFTEVLAYAQKQGARSVLDFGCGEGAFLDLAASRGLRTGGLEYAPEAAKKCRARGHDVLSGPFEQITHQALPMAELVTMFQVVEHVKDPVGFVSHAKEFVAPGGLIVVAVPYDSGINRWATLLPHQWPPHHLTRWRHQDLRFLAKRCALELVSLKANALPPSELRRYLRLNAKMAAAINPPRRSLPPWLITVLGWTYGLLGGPYWPYRLGVSTTAIYRQPC